MGHYQSVSDKDLAIRISHAFTPDRCATLAVLCLVQIAPVKMGSPQKQYRLAEVEMKNGKLSAPVWIVYKDSVYDVTSFVNQHPGGDDAILGEAGTDSTKAFQDVGHSEDARASLAQYKIGEIVEEEKKYDANGKKKKKVIAAKDDSTMTTGRSCLNVATCGILG